MPDILLKELRARVAELEERRCEVCGYAEHHREHTGCLRNQVSSLKAELREICAAIDDPACDLTLTTVECIKKLKAENEWQPIETAPKGERFLTTTKLRNGSFGQVGISHSFFCYEVNTRDWEIAGDDPRATHWTPLPTPPKRSMEGV